MAISKYARSISLLSLAQGAVTINLTLEPLFGLPLASDFGLSPALPTIAVASPIVALLRRLASGAGAGRSPNLLSPLFTLVLATACAQNPTKML